MGAGHEQRELEELPSVEGQLRDLALVNDLSHHCVAHVKQRNSLLNFDLLSEASGVEYHIVRIAGSLPTVSATVGSKPVSSTVIKYSPG